MKTIYSPNPVNETHLQDVMSEMASIGKGPMVQAVDFGGFMVALEGSHRMEAARRLGMPVAMLPIDRKAMLVKGDVPGLWLGGHNSVKAKKLGLAMLRGRSKAFSPVYEWDEETGLLSLKYYPTCSASDAARIVGITTLVWAAVAAAVIAAVKLL